MRAGFGRWARGRSALQRVPVDSVSEGTPAAQNISL